MMLEMLALLAMAGSPIFLAAGAAAVLSVGVVIAQSAARTRRVFGANAGSYTVVLLEEDQHYQYIPLIATSLTQGGADQFATVQIADDTIAPQIAINFFGKGQHALLVWDVKDFVVERSVHTPVVNVITSAQVQLVGDNGRDATAPTAIMALKDEDWIDGRSLAYSALTVTGVGEIVMVDDSFLSYWPQPTEYIDGNKFGQMLTAAHYHLNYDTALTAKANVVSGFGMHARRVAMRMEEAFFQQRDVAEILLATQLSSY